MDEEKKIIINNEPVTEEQFREIKEDKSKRLIEDDDKPNSFRVLERMTE
jgi:hypothetical protein